MRSVGWPELLVILGLLVLLFGGRKLPQLGKGLGEAGRRFKRGWKGEGEAVPPDREVALGRRWAEKIERGASILDDRTVTEYLNRVAERVARSAGLRVPVVAKVIDDPHFSAFALPGGFVYVTTGLMLSLSEEAELAAAVAHEIAHVTERHALRKGFRHAVLEWGSFALRFFRGRLVGLARDASGPVIRLAGLKCSRDFEREADRLALHYLSAAGYDPQALVSFFEKLRQLESDDPALIGELLRTHPPVAERLELVRRNIRELGLQRDEPAVTSAEFAAVQARLLTLRS